MSKPIIFQPGVSSNVYEWSNDTIHVKLNGKNEQTPFTVIEDNLKETFDLPLHMHKTHTETFYVIDGEVEFTVGENKFVAPKGTFVHVPEKIPHGVKVRSLYQFIFYLFVYVFIYNFFTVYFICFVCSFFHVKKRHAKYQKCL
jgi:quercetin dioxygenase-like cupin family protein